MKQLKFEHRKAIHYALLSCIILLQVLAIVTWYNESKLSQAFDDMSASNKIVKYANLINNSLVKSQVYFNKYISDKDENALKNYDASLEDMGRLMDSIRQITNGNNAFEDVLKKKNKTEADILVLKSSIDSIIDKHIGKSGGSLPHPYELKKFEPATILDNIKTDSYVKMDKANQKRLFSRIADAFAGRVSIQKEYIKTVVQMKYKDKATTGNVEEQIAHVLSIMNQYYENEFKTLKKSFTNIRESDLRLMELNNQLLQMSQQMAVDYNNYPHLLHADGQSIQDQYKTHQRIRSYSIALLILLMLVVSVILFNFTRMAFDYEKRLTLAEHQIRQSLNFKNRITGMISHEIRSPLSIISMYSKKASASTKDEALRETFKSIEFTTNSLLLLSNQILEYSKNEHSELTLKNTRIDLKAEIDQILEAMTALVEARGNRLKIQSNIDAKSEVYADAAKIHQLFYNIIGNANKFTEHGLINILLQLKPLSDFEMKLNVTISDNGIGIAEDDLKNIFDSYYQGTVSEKVNNLGVGLGLNICKQIIELFEGEINIESQQNKGTTVTFYLILTQI